MGSQLDKNKNENEKDRDKDKEYPTVKVEGKKVPFDPTQLRRIQEHPCFSEKACHIFGRIHLPVAPECNIQCNYCVRKFDCVNESRPGVTSRVITPEEAIDRVREVVKRFPNIKVVGIAGPGEPLFNEQTFETFQLLKKEFPKLIFCVSTNGLLLPEKIDELDKLDVRNITITINAIDPEIASKIYSWVYYQDQKYQGMEGAKILINNQLRGLEEAVRRRMIVKVNTVLIPTINDSHVIEIAKKIANMGAYMHNIIPLIPQYKLSHIRPPTPEEKESIQKECSKYIKEMKHCRQCRADAIGKLGKDLQKYLFD